MDFPLGVRSGAVFSGELAWTVPQRRRVLQVHPLKAELSAEKLGDEAPHSCVLTVLFVLLGREKTPCHRLFLRSSTCTS